jgi:dTDP-4-dehydrorhamnose reductase
MGDALTKFIVTGAGGLLGQAFVNMLGGADVCKISRDRLDADRPTAVIDAILAASPQFILNCAAHTDLEAAERESELDFKVNARLPAAIAEAARVSGALLVHFSSTGCYGNWKSEPYSEDDEMRPTTAHHRAKKAGEDAIRLSGCRHLILRTGWLYGGAASQPKNFVWRRLVEARSLNKMTSDGSQRGSPTYVEDLARQTLAIIDSDQTGTFNATAHGAAYRYEYVREVFEAAELPCAVEAGPPFKRLAPVSPNESAVNARLQALGLDLMQDWRLPLRGYVRSLLVSDEWNALGQHEPAR